ncbi:MAG: hypothetical protein V7727_16480, partial [Sneathiella sp.]
MSYLTDRISRYGVWTGGGWTGSILRPLDINGNPYLRVLTVSDYALKGVDALDTYGSKYHDLNEYHAEYSLRKTLAGVGLASLVIAEVDGLQVYAQTFDMSDRFINYDEFQAGLEATSLANRAIAVNSLNDYYNHLIKSNQLIAIESMSNGVDVLADGFMNGIKAELLLLGLPHLFLGENANILAAQKSLHEEYGGLIDDFDSKDYIKVHVFIPGEGAKETAFSGSIDIDTGTQNGDIHQSPLTPEEKRNLTQEQTAEYLGAYVSIQMEQGTVTREDLASRLDFLDAQPIDTSDQLISKIGGIIFDVEIVPSDLPIPDGYILGTGALEPQSPNNWAIAIETDPYVLSEHFEIGDLELYNPQLALEILVYRSAKSGAGLEDFLAEGVSLRFALKALSLANAPWDVRAQLSEAIKKEVVNIGDLEKFSAEELESLGLVVVSGETKDTRFPEKALSSLGSAIGGQLASYFAGDKLAVQIAANSVGSAFGSTIGEALAGKVPTGSFAAHFGKRIATNFVGGIGSLVATSIFDELFELDGVIGDLASLAVGALGAQLAVYAYTAATASAGVAAAEFTWATYSGGLYIAAASYTGSALGQKVRDGNPEGEAIGGAVGAAIGIAVDYYYGGDGTIGAFIGSFLGTVIGGYFGGDPALPEAVSLVELGFRLDAQGFFVVDGYAKDGGSAEAARNIGQAGANALNAFLYVVGGRALDFNRNIGFGYVGSQYIGSGGRRFGSVDALIDAEVTNIFKEIEIEGGDLYMKRALANTTADNIADLSDDLGIAVRYGQYMDNQVLFLEELPDWEQDEWAATLLHAEEELNLDDAAASDTYTREGNFGFDIYVERQDWVKSSEFIPTGDGGEGYYQDKWKTATNWQSVSAYRELNINGKDTLILELGIYSEDLNFSLSGDDLTITVLNPTPPAGDTADYTETFLIRDWVITWNQFDTLRFLSGQEFDIASALALENGENIDLAAVATNVFSSAIAPVFYEQTAESPGTLVEGAATSDTLSGSVDTDDTLMGGAGDDAYSFGADSGDDLVFDTRWDLEIESKAVEYWGRKGQSKGSQEVTYWTDEYGIHENVTGKVYSGSVDSRQLLDSFDATSYVEKNAGTADKVLFESGVLEEHVSFSLIGNDLIV